MRWQVLIFSFDMSSAASQRETSTFLCHDGTPRIHHHHLHHGDKDSEGTSTSLFRKAMATALLSSMTTICSASDRRRVNANCARMWERIASRFCNTRSQPTHNHNRKSGQAHRILSSDLGEEMRSSNNPTPPPLDILRRML